MKPTFVLCKDWINYTNEMSNEDRWILLNAIMQYQNWLDPWDLPYAVKIVFAHIKNFFVDQEKKYEEIKEKRSESGKKWGRPTTEKAKKANAFSEKQTKAKQNKQKLTETDTDTNKKNIYLEIYNTRNNKNITQHKKLNEEIKKSIEKILQDLSESEVIQAIENYATIYHSDKTYFKHKWTLSEFLSRKNGARVFLYKSEEDYLDKDKKQSKNNENYSTEARNLAT